MNDLECVIGETEWQVGQVVLWLDSLGRKSHRTITGFGVNRRNGQTEAVLDNHHCFNAEDVEKGFVQVTRE